MGEQISTISKACKEAYNGYQDIKERNKHTLKYPECCRKNVNTFLRYGQTFDDGNHYGQCGVSKDHARVYMCESCYQKIILNIPLPIEQFTQINQPIIRNQISSAQLDHISDQIYSLQHEIPENQQISEQQQGNKEQIRLCEWESSQQSWQRFIGDNLKELMDEEIIYECQNCRKIVKKQTAIQKISCTQCKARYVQCNPEVKQELKHLQNKKKSKSKKIQKAKKLKK